MADLPASSDQPTMPWLDIGRPPGSESPSAQTMATSALVSSPVSMSSTFDRILAQLQRHSPPPRPPPSDQPSPATLLKQGVKVRDFAYESTLPPLPSIGGMTLIRQQIQPGPMPRPIKRARLSDESDAADPLTSPLAAPPTTSKFDDNLERSPRPESKRSKPLRRQSTEPAAEHDAVSLRRTFAFPNAPASQLPTSQAYNSIHDRSSVREEDDYGAYSHNSPDASSQSQPPDLVFQSQSQSQSPSQPLRTPQSSQYTLAAPIFDQSSIPLSQLDDPDSEDISYDQPSLSPLKPSQMDADGAVAPPRSSSPPPTANVPMSPLPAESQDSGTVASRYNLRKRVRSPPAAPVARQSAQLSAKPPSRSKPLKKPTSQGQPIRPVRDRAMIT